MTEEQIRAEALVLFRELGAIESMVDAVRNAPLAQVFDACDTMRNADTTSVLRRKLATKDQ